MTTALEQLRARFTAESHHSFLMHGNTRDLQLGATGSCSLVEYFGGKFAETDWLPVVYCVGIGWRFAQDSDRQLFMELVGLDSGQTSGSPFAGLGAASNEDLPLPIAEAIGVVDAAMRQTGRNVAIILDRIELICPATSYDRMSPADKAVLSILQKIAADSTVATTGNILIGICDALPDLHDSLRLASSRYYAIEISPPDFDERLAIADQVLPQLQSNGCRIELDAQEFSRATSMLTRYGLMDILQDAKATGLLSRDQVRSVKSQVMSQEYGDILETLDPLPNGFEDIAGMDALKSYIQSSVIANMLSGNHADVAAGILFAGAAGLGKTLFCRGIAGSSGLPVINFNIGRLLGSFVGQSERNLERAITAIKSAQPCFVVLDEIETSFPDRATSGPSGDSGVSSRILKRMLEVLSDPALRGRVVWIGITNYPSKLDAALARAGRFDMTVAFTPPTKAERIALIMLYVKKYSIDEPSEDCIELLADRTAGYTNSEIELVCRKARTLLPDASWTDAAWTAAIDRVRANTRGVQEMTDAALQAVNDSDLLHPDYIARWRRVTNQDADPAAESGSGQPSGNRAAAGKKLF